MNSASHTHPRNIQDNGGGVRSKGGNSLRLAEAEEEVDPRAVGLGGLLNMPVKKKVGGEAADSIGAKPISVCRPQGLGQPIPVGHISNGVPRRRDLGQQGGRKRRGQLVPGKVSHVAISQMPPARSGSRKIATLQRTGTAPPDLSR